MAYGSTAPPLGQLVLPWPWEYRLSSLIASCLLRGGVDRAKEIVVTATEVFTVHIESVSGCGVICEYIERLNLSDCLMIMRG